MSETAAGNHQLVLASVPANGPAAFDAPVFNIPASAADGRISHSLSATADHKLFVFRASSLDHPIEIYAAKPGAHRHHPSSGFTQLSHLKRRRRARMGKAESVNWKNEGFNVQGWLLLPKNYDPREKISAYSPRPRRPRRQPSSPAGAQAGGISGVAFSALGYFVLQANPRGSFGQGEAFVQANRKDFGYGGDLRDILTGARCRRSQISIDDKRIGLTGWSYGGFMSMFAVTQTHRFRAAVTGAGISNWQSYYGENSIGQWMIPYFGASVYDDPKVYAKSSAIDYIKQVTTPTLVVVGDRDGECPAPQSYEFWACPARSSCAHSSLWFIPMRATVL